ncbi:MAG: hypothetical protein AAGA65_30630 [Actinomycetota bacterium]
MAKPDGSGDRGQQAEVDIEVLLDGPAMADEPAGPDDAAADLGDTAGYSARLSGEATVGDSRARLLAGTGVVAVLVAVVGLLVGIDRAAPEPEPPPITRRQPSGLVTTTTRSAAERNRVITLAPTVPPTTLPPGEFLLGEETGLWLFVGGDGTLQRLNLDNGELVDYGIRAAPIASSGADLVLYARISGLVGWIPAAVPGQQPFAWKPGYAAPPDEAGRLWVLDPGDDTPHPAGVPVGSGSWELFDTVSATAQGLGTRPGDLYESVEARRPSADQLPPAAAAIRPGPDLSVRPDGVVAYTDTGYRSLVDGPVDVLAASADRILIRTCSPEPCALTWLPGVGGDRSEAAVEPTPDQLPNPDVLWAGFVAGGSWLLAYYPGGESELIALDAPGRYRFWAGANPAMSEDGRLMAVQTGGQYAVVDVVTGEERYRFGEPAPDGPPGDPGRPADNGLLFVSRG